MPHADPETRRLYCRDWKRRHRGRYAARDKVYSAARHANQRAVRAGDPGRITADEAARILAVGRCHYCGGVDELGLDHVVPISRGGRNVLGNLVACCLSCNASKWAVDRPRRWSRRGDSCRRCGTAERPHVARDMCGRCYQATWGSWTARAARRVEREAVA